MVECFEVSLGKLDIQRFVELYTPPPKTEQEILNAIKEKKERKDSSEIFPPSLAYDSPCAKRLIGLFDIVGYCLRKWVLSFTSITDAKYIHLEKENSVFVNFNYTRTLELLYDIPEGNILHIHGSAFKSEKLVFGHNSSHRGMFYAFDAEKVSDALDTYEKNPYEYIFKNKTFFRKIEDVKHIHIYGLSLSPVDINYLDWIYQNTPSSTDWEFSLYSVEDKNRIDRFLFSHWDLKSRIKLIQLKDIEQSE